MRRALLSVAPLAGCHSSQPDGTRSDPREAANPCGADAGRQSRVPPLSRESAGGARHEPSNGGGTAGGEDAAPGHVDASADADFEWPDTTLLEPSLALEASLCRTYYDESSDGTVERSWGFEYDAEGKLARWHTRTGDALEVTLFDAQSRPRGRCRRGACQRLDHLEGGALVKIDDVDRATGHVTGGVGIELRYGEPDDPLDHVSLGCRFAPASSAIEEAYDVARSSRGRRWCW